jgi:8-oxo-dGTP pyrophosphatase MutT (NUDIX family)
MADAPAEPKLSATVLLLRDRGDQLEVFMVQRDRPVEISMGALVFPGGKVDATDDGASMRGACDGVEGLTDDEVTVRVAAIRETFEESGVLLARPRGHAELVGAERLAGIEAKHRESLLADDITLGQIAQLEQLALACDRLVPFAHWITPVVLPKRFDTQFFLVDAPDDQVALHDGQEMTESIWTTVEGAMAAEASGERTIVFPTKMNLSKLGRSTSVADAMAAAQSKPIVTVLPSVRKDDDGELMLFMPEEADYDITKAPVSALR